ncbi:alkaline ceramidase-like [Abrus precatorius]|uniref:Alkaline ceramidase-like n=1 Tax=Abrus precatorius TaxID=3816 RepID=A0A8B8MBW2_ABRPR|nr:alkaline ceramidase-like [Abrus precatorius]
MAKTISSFWGPVTSTTECCEKNYAYSSYIAEFYNTISNIPAILLALIGLRNAFRQRFEKRFSVLQVSNMTIAIGSMLYHATLQHVQQQSDETPMVWEILLYIYILYSPDWHYRRTMPIFLVLYGAVFAIAHSVFRFDIGFKLHYVILCLLCIPRMYKYCIYTEDVSAKRIAKLYVATLVLGTLFWLCDRVFCEEISRWPINLQCHALWHVFLGFSSYFANTFLMFCRAQQRGWSPKVVRLMGVLPYVKIEKSKNKRN